MARSWQDVHASLRDRDLDELSPAELEQLADAAWWLCRVEESVEARARAEAGHAAVGDHARAAWNAWMLATEHRMLGHDARARGWLQKARRHVEDRPETVEHGYVAYGAAEQAEDAGDLDEALVLADLAVAIGLRQHSRELVAMGRQLQGRLLIAAGREDEGLALVDEAMADVLAGQLDDLTTGWVYCVAVALCFDLADLHRATEWNDAAMAWCESLPAGTPYHGLCRVHRAELLGLGGDWDRAGREADRACDELLAYHPAFAAEAFYVAGDVRRRRGDLAGAEEAYRRAHESGYDPQPGLALLRLAQGRTADAAAALDTRLSSGGGPLLVRARLLLARVEVALAVDDDDAARAAAASLDRLGGASTPVVRAMADEAVGAVAFAAGDEEALPRLRRALAQWLDLHMPHEASRVRVRIARACLDLDDRDSARLELQAAREVFTRLGSSADVEQVDGLLHPGDARPGGLTPREVEVLRLVATGATNRDIATALVISEHTVARHLNNIFTKLGVSSRAAATAFAYEHDVAAADGPF